MRTRPLQLRYYFYGVILLIAGCAACSQLGLQAPQTTQDRLQYGKANVTAAYRSIGDLKSQGRITATDGAGYFHRVEQVENQLADAEKLLALKLPADDKITAALKVLAIIQTELRSKGKP